MFFVLGVNFQDFITASDRNQAVVDNSSEMGQRDFRNMGENEFIFFKFFLK